MKVEVSKLFSTVHKEIRTPRKEVKVTRSHTIRTPRSIVSRLATHTTFRPLAKQIRVQSEKVYLEPSSAQSVAPVVHRKWHKVPSLIHKTPKEQRKAIKDSTKRLLFANVNFMLEGMLCEGKDGLYYLSIDADLYKSMCTHFSNYPLEDAPYAEDMGPSVPLILPSERPFGSIPVSATLPFQIADVYIQEHHDWPGITSSLALELFIPDATLLRDKLGLSATPLMKPFTLVLGVTKAHGQMKEKGYYHVNVSESLV